MDEAQELGPSFLVSCCDRCDLAPPLSRVILLYNLGLGTKYVFLHVGWAQNLNLFLVVSPCWSDPKYPMVSPSAAYLEVHGKYLNVSLSRKVSSA
jgi:hypothetical protein